MEQGNGVGDFHPPLPSARRLRMMEYPGSHPSSRQCPRCHSDDTKFCYFNNYNMNQPRYENKRVQPSLPQLQPPCPQANVAPLAFGPLALPPMVTPYRVENGYLNMRSSSLLKALPCPKHFVKNQIPDSILNDASLNVAISLLPANYNFGIHKCVWRIRFMGAKRVALQFPEASSWYSLVIVDILTTFTSAAHCFVLGTSPMAPAASSTTHPRCSLIY
nr:diphthamide biosynthesis protein 1 [Ipomoea batatas]